ncbi:MAG: hypothetical protein MUQ32_02205, partial [Chloroflexi bacterium]|nr:hypothetical protein [Chloroflexota bacterium]
CCSGGTIYYKSTPLDRVDFPPGRGSVLMKRTSNALNNPAASKGDVTGETGLVVIASDDKADFYMHNAIALAGPPVPKPVPSAVAPVPGVEPGTSAGAGTTVLFQDGFESGGLEAWSDVSSGPQSQVGVEAGAARTDRFGLRLASGASPDGFGYARIAVPEIVKQLSVDLDIRLVREGLPDANTPLVRLLAPDGSRIFSVYRQNRSGGRIWTSTPDTRAATLGRMALDTWAHFDVRTWARGADMVADVRLDGQLIGEVILSNLDPGIGSIQVGNETKGQTFEINVDNVRVRR